VPETHRKSEQARHDAIHRALLTGLLSNVGQKTEAHEYTGARGKKFYIHPGSALFKKDPRWLMAAELVETTRLYARTDAAIDPAWIERLADHLLKRAYSDPHWNSATGHVVAYEKVTLYGLVLVPQRPVHYGPIDPRLSREIFINSALVEGDWRSDAPFLRHNRKLIEEVEALEAKKRTRDVLVDAKVRFDFYDARIPAGITNAPQFERWRKEAERNHSKLLFMTKRDLMQDQAHGVTAHLFPDHLTIAGVTLPLEYHLEVGHPMDGVTATIPLPVVSQLPAEPFEWLVPGLLKEKIAALIKSLPKELRVNFVPAPDYAEQAARDLKPYEGSLIEALSLYLGRVKGLSAPISSFDPGSLLDHLHMNFKVVDQHGKQLAMGRNLEALRKQLGLQVRATFSSLQHPQYHKDNITRWDFGDLPEAVTVQRHGMTLTAYPALVDVGGRGHQMGEWGSGGVGSRSQHAERTPPSKAATAITNPNLVIASAKAQAVALRPSPHSPTSALPHESSVALRLFESKAAADAAHASGLRRLLTLHLRDELRYLGSNIPGLSQMCLHYAPLGPCEELRADLIGETINRAFLYDAKVRTPMEFELRLNAGRRHRLLEVARDVAGLAREILAAYHQVSVALEKPMIPAFAPTLKDVRQQLAQLMPRGFLTTTPDEWLAQFPRILRAAQLRLEKLVTTGHTRDQQRMAEIEPFWRMYLDQLQKNRAQNIHDAALDHFRWLVEEYRVSLFAQELKTSVPISAKRLERQWEQVRK
jgi:ATP-dependent helicase HrpA